MNILIITTNYSGNDSDSLIKDTGVWLEEYALPYIVFKDTGYNVTTASIKGGLSPVDENSLSCSNPMEWDDCIKELRKTKKLSEVDIKNYDCVYFPGGHGPMFDIANSNEIKNTVEYFYNEEKIISSVCHGVAALIQARDRDGKPIVEGKMVTSFTNKEEKIQKLDTMVPFLLESKLIELGANFQEEEPFKEHAVIDKNIITGQNQNSALLVAEYTVAALNNK